MLTNQHIGLVVGALDYGAGLAGFIQVPGLLCNLNFFDCLPVFLQAIHSLLTFTSFVDLVVKYCCDLHLNKNVT